MARRQKGKVVVKPNYVVRDLRNPPKSQVVRYRRIKRGGHVMTIAILRNGKTRLTSIWHPKTERRSQSDAGVTRILRRIHKQKRKGRK